jgi:hypothetical protein
MVMRIAFVESSASTSLYMSCQIIVMAPTTDTSVDKIQKDAYNATSGRRVAIRMTVNAIATPIIDPEIAWFSKMSMLFMNTHFDSPTSLPLPLSPRSVWKAFPHAALAGPALITSMSF